MVQTGLHIKSQDININEFRFRFKNDTGEELNLNAEFQVDVLSFFSRAGTKSLTTARVLGNFAFWEFDTALISGDDTVVNYVYVKRNGVPITSADANGFTFDVSLSKLDENTGRVAEAYDKNYEKILHEFEVAINLTKDEWAQMADEARNFVDEIKDVTVDQFVELKMGEELANLEVNYATRLTGLEQKDNQLTAQLAQMAVKGSGVSTNLSLRNGWVGTVRWRKSDGDVVTIEVDVAKPSSISPLDDIATLPANIRTFEKVFPVVSISTGKIEFLYINANGILRTPANSTLQPSLSYHGVITYTV